MQIKAVILLLVFFSQYIPSCALISNCCDSESKNMTLDYSNEDNSEKEWPKPANDCGEKCHRLNLTSTILISAMSPSFTASSLIYTDAHFHYKGLDDEIHHKDILHPPII